MSETTLISIVVPCYNEEAVFPMLRAALVRLGEEIEPRHRVEFVLVDDGSRDETWSLIEAFAKDDSRVRGVSFSRNFGHQSALTCGYHLAAGDAVVSMDADLQDPPEVVLELVEKWEQGADIVYAIRETREGETRFKLWSASLFYRLIRFMGAREVRANAGDFRLMSRRSLDALNRMGETHRFIRGMVGWVGFKTDEVHYRRQPRLAGETKYPLRRMLRLALDATVSFSVFPLRITFVFAATLAFLILSFLVVAGIQWVFFDKPLVPGWASLLLAIMGFGVVSLLCMGIMGEYVGRIYEQVKGRPLYLIRDDTGSPSHSGVRSSPAEKGGADE